MIEYIYVCVVSHVYVWSLLSSEQSIHIKSFPPLSHLTYLCIISLALSAVDESKLTDALGPGFPVPVEIVPFCHEHTLRTVAALPSCEGCKPVLRMGSSQNNKIDGDNIAVTDNGNYIVDLHFETPIKDAVKMANDIKNTVGVVDHGLFCGMTTAVIIAGKDGISVKNA